MYKLFFSILGILSLVSLALISNVSGQTPSCAANAAINTTCTCPAGVQEHSSGYCCYSSSAPNGAWYSTACATTTPTPTPTLSDSPPTISASVKSANELHPSTIYAGLRAYITVSITDDNGINYGGFNAPEMKYSSADVTISACSGGVKSCSEPVYVLVPSRSGSYTITVKATDTAGQTSTQTITFTAAACSANSECGGTYFPSSGATFCDSTGLKVMKYQVVSVCSSGVCDEKTEPGVLEDCTASGKICDFSTTAGGQYQCVAGTPPTACALNAPITTRCICGSGAYGGGYNSYSGYSAGYCCGSGSNIFQTSPGPCPTPYPSSTPTPTPIPNGTNYTTRPIPTQTPQSEPVKSPTPFADTCGDKICSIQETAYKSCPKDCESQTNPPSIPTSCKTDQDCAWLSANSCPETAGAAWACGSLLAPMQKNPAICPQILSPRPSANCGCIQNACVVYEKEKPKEPPKKIGNTNVDSTTLLGIVIQMEQLKIKFEYLKSAISKLSNYYNSTGNPASAEKWSKASDLLQQGIDRIDSLKLEIKEKLSMFTVEDLRKLKKDVKAVISIIGDAVRAVL